MSRYFNGKEVELLAPAGTFEVFLALLETGCDAIYMGGRILNMRMIRKGYNLSDEEVKKAVMLAHEKGKKVYITINNLFNKEDIESAKEYLVYLDKEVKPDAIIVQDFAVLELIKKLKLGLIVHSSVMMNVHNLEMVKRLKELGITRVVTSREMDLQTIKNIKSEVKDMEFEYFMHGDMCVAHGSQCLYSSLLFGMSSNRGRCLKPCRWDFKIKKDGNIYDSEFPIAVKDMYMYENIPELIEAGVTSFKIEGRMREKEFIVNLVNTYSKAIDRYLTNPIGYSRTEGSEEIYNNRKRDLSTAYAFGKPGIENINRRYEGTGKFYSTGKVFSVPTKEKEITDERLIEIKEALSELNDNPKHGKISVKVNNIEQALMCIENKVDVVYLSGEVYYPNHNFTVEEIKTITSKKGTTKIYLGTPKFMDDLTFSEYNHLLKNNDLNIDGILVTNIGVINAFKQFELELVGDNTLNIYNSLAAKFYMNEGISKYVMSYETPVNDIKNIISGSQDEIEILAHGKVDAMHLEYNLYDSLKHYFATGKEDNLFVDNDVMVLKSDMSENPVYLDNRKRNHVLSNKEVCLIDLVSDLKQKGITTFRIEGSDLKVDYLEKIIKEYQKCLNGQMYNKDLFKNYSLGLTLGSLHYN